MEEMSGRGRLNPIFIDGQPSFPRPSEHTSADRQCHRPPIKGCGAALCPQSRSAMTSL